MDITDILELKDSHNIISMFMDDEEEILYTDVYKTSRFAATHNLSTDKVMLQGWVELDKGPKHFTIEGTNWRNAQLAITDLLVDPSFPIDSLEDAVKYWKEQINE